jgi:hypothetical protein
MDPRYKPLTDYVVRRFSDHLGPRQQSVFVHGSVARGDAVWGVSDLDLVVAFEHPNKSDNELKHEVEATAKNLPAGDALIIQRISNDRLQQLSEGKRAYCLYSYRYDSEVLYGINPTDFLPKPPTGYELTKLIAPIIRKAGEVQLNKSALDRLGSRQLAKRILNGVALPSIAEGKIDYARPLEVTKLALPQFIVKHLDSVVPIYSEAPVLTNIRPLVNAWNDTWKYIEQSGLILDKSISNFNEVNSTRGVH